MLNFIAQTGHAATIVDFTSDVSMLLTGLIGITWFAAGMIVAAVVQERHAQKMAIDNEATPPMPTAMTYQHAA